MSKPITKMIYEHKYEFIKENGKPPVAGLMSDKDFSSLMVEFSEYPHIYMFGALGVQINMVNLEGVDYRRCYGIQDGTIKMY